MVSSTLDAARRRGDASACAAHDDAALAGECVAMAARERARAGDLDGARLDCASIPAGMWRDECAFLLADAQDAAGDEAHRLCGDAGRYRSQCLSHAMAREVNALLTASPAGAEDQAYLGVLRLGEAYLPANGGVARAQAMFVNHLAGREPNRPFGPLQCGSAPAELCAAAYAERVRRQGAGAEAWQATCPGPPDSAAAAAIGLPAWDAAFAPQLASAWALLCQDDSHRRRQLGR